ncbi:MAG: flagellar motor switch phosphatase FliY [Lachnospiraceae bacterium]|nr:flagellar motor switch phosphatase FliY [Lachnospiraceae bacterium]
MDGGMLSQDEINALLAGMDLSGDEPAEPAESMLSPAEDPMPMPDAYLAGTPASNVGEDALTDVEKDAIGEVANISMGSSATTLYSLVNKKVNITTPVVELATWDRLLEAYEKPCVFIQIKYTKGLDGTNILILKEHDVKVITDLMMGGDGTNVDGELSDLHLSAISEAMNQMMGSAATSLSTMLQTMIDISPPDSSLLDLAKFHDGGEIAPFLGGTFVKISFRMQIDELVDSTIMQLYPIEFAKKLVETFISTQMGGMDEPEPAPTPAPDMSSGSQMGMNQMGGMDTQTNMGMNSMGMNQMGMNQMGGMDAQMNIGMNPMGMNQMGMNQMGGMDSQMNIGMNSMGMNQMGMNMGMNPQMGMNPMGMNMGMNPMMGMQQNVNVQPAQFQNFSNDMPNMTGQENIGLIMDVPLEVTVELGRTSKSISEILNFAPGTIIELDRIAGEPIDVLVNGKFVAKGEVVVIEESYGIRVTEIVK